MPPPTSTPLGRTMTPSAVNSAPSSEKAPHSGVVWVHELKIATPPQHPRHGQLACSACCSLAPGVSASEMVTLFGLARRTARNSRKYHYLFLQWSEADQMPPSLSGKSVAWCLRPRLFHEHIMRDPDVKTHFRTTADPSATSCQRAPGSLASRVPPACTLMRRTTAADSQRATRSSRRARLFGTPRGAPPRCCRRAAAVAAERRLAESN